MKGKIGFVDIREPKLIVTKEWVEDLRDLFFDWEHSHEEPVDRSDGQRSTDEIWGEIVETFGKIGVEIVEVKDEQE